MAILPLPSHPLSSLQSLSNVPSSGTCGHQSGKWYITQSLSHPLAVSGRVMFCTMSLWRSALTNAFFFFNKKYHQWNLVCFVFVFCFCLWKQMKNSFIWKVLLGEKNKYELQGKIHCHRKSPEWITTSKITYHTYFCHWLYKDHKKWVSEGNFRI